MSLHMLPEDMQRTNEIYYARKHIDPDIQKFIETDEVLQQAVDTGTQYFDQWLNNANHHESKQARLQQLVHLDYRELVVGIFTEIAYCYRPELFVSLTGKLASRLSFSDRADSIKTIAEVVTVLSYTGAFTLFKNDEMGRLYVQATFDLPPQLHQRIARSEYLPPMVCEPRDIHSNYESPLITINESVMLGRGNNHNGDLCLDVVNTQNKVPLQLVWDLISTEEEFPKPDMELDTHVKQADWQHFKVTSYQMNIAMHKQGNHFWLLNKYDARGRLYAQGYHITTQGSAYKKASVELANEEVVNGVPLQLQRKANTHHTA